MLLDTMIVKVIHIILVLNLITIGEGTKSFVSPSGIKYFIGQSVIFPSPDGTLHSGTLVSYGASGLKVKRSDDKNFNLPLKEIDKVVSNEMATQCSIYKGSLVLVKLKKDFRLAKIKGFLFKVHVIGDGSRWVRSGMLRRLKVGSVKCQKQVSKSCRDCGCPTKCKVLGSYSKVLIKAGASHWYPGTLSNRKIGKNRIVARVFGKVLVKNLQTDIVQDITPNPRKLLVHDAVLLSNPWGKLPFYVKGYINAVGYAVQYLDKQREKSVAELSQVRLMPRQPYFIKERMRNAQDLLSGRGIDQLRRNQRVVGHVNGRGMIGNIDRINRILSKRLVTFSFTFRLPKGSSLFGHEPNVKDIVLVRDSKKKRWVKAMVINKTSAVFILRSLVSKKVLFMKLSNKNGVIPDKLPHKSWLTTGVKVIALRSAKTNKEENKKAKTPGKVWRRGEVQFKENKKYVIIFKDDVTDSVARKHIRLLRKQPSSGLELLHEMFEKSSEVTIGIRGVRYIGKVESAGNKYVKVKITIPLKEPPTGSLREIVKRMSFVSTLKLSDLVNIKIGCTKYPSRVEQISSYIYQGVPYKYMKLSFSTVKTYSRFSVGNILRIKINKYPYNARVLDKRNAKVYVLVPFRVRSNKLPKSLRNKLRKIRSKLRFLYKDMNKRGTNIYANIGGSWVASVGKVKFKRNSSKTKVTFKKKRFIGTSKYVPLTVEGRFFLGKVTDRTGNTVLLRASISRDVIRKSLLKEKKMIRTKTLERMLSPPKVPALFLTKTLFGYSFFRWFRRGDRVYAMAGNGNVWYPAKITRIGNNKGGKRNVFFRYLNHQENRRKSFSFPNTAKVALVPYRQINRIWIKPRSSVLVMRGRRFGFGAIFGVVRRYVRNSGHYLVKIPRLASRSSRLKRELVLVPYERLILMPNQPPSVSYGRLMDHYKTILSYDGASWTRDGRRRQRPWFWNYRIRRERAAYKKLARRRQRAAKRRRRYDVLGARRPRRPRNPQLKKYRKTSKRRQVKHSNRYQQRRRRRGRE